MTAEIALLNKLAVTLAADSAVTITIGGSQKVYNSADKIFEVTNHDPIGVMVYNNPELHGVPVEAIIKMYRDRECKNSFDTVFAFATAFLAHLEQMVCPPVTVEENIFGSLLPKIRRVHALHRKATDEFVESLREQPDQSGEEILAGMEAAALRTFDDEIARLNDLEQEAWSNGLTVDDVLAAHVAVISELIEYVYEGTTLSENAHQHLRIIGALSLLKEYERQRLTGLVFAGFGAKEIFPSLNAFDVYGTVAGKLKYKETHRFDVDRTLVPIAEVIPFAQQEMVERFIYGMDNQFLGLCDTFFDGSLNALRARIEDATQGLEGELGTTLREAIGASVSGIMEEFRTSIVPDHLRTSRSQLADMVRSMPKQELAALSESLVHITSLKRKFSAEAESVGGPIDVAMITRAEGFVWVKRKHFFDPNYNPRYFYRKYGRPISPTGQQEQTG